MTRLFVIIIILILFLMGFIPNVPLHPVLRVILIGHNPFNLKRLFNNSQDVGCLWDLPWIVGYMLSIVFIETETTAMMFMDSEIGSSSIEVPPNGIGSELEGRPEILRMDQNPQQPTGDGDREVTSSSSGNWRQYLDLSSDKEGDSAPDTSTARVPNQGQQQGEEAGPSNQPLPVEAYPYSDHEVIGGDSVSAIQLRLLRKKPFPSANIIRMARLDAQDIFEVKVDIIKIMAQWDPTGDWMGRGARALDNMRTDSGEEFLVRLCEIRKDLEEIGPLADIFSTLQEKVFKKR
jgi:hypothetical protein